VSIRYGQYLVGLHYEQGLTVAEDPEKSKEYYLKSAMQDFPDAQSSLGIRLADDGNHTDAIVWLEKAVQNVSFFFFLHCMPAFIIY
jgi:TPR repeat protein